MELMACPAACDSTGQEVKSNDVVVDVPLVMEPDMWPECCIYRVPKKLHKVNKEAYIPMLVSIGPLYHGREELEDMEKHKLRYLKDFLFRTGMSQEDLLKIIQDNEFKIRHCYSEDCRLSSTDFVKMILLDAIFIIELFLRLYINLGEDYDSLILRTREKEDSYILSQSWLITGIRRDLILLENQLPIFVLEKLYKFAFGGTSNPHNQIDFRSLSIMYFIPYFYRAGMQLLSFNISEVKHFTDLLRYVFTSAVPNSIQKPRGYLDNLYSATKLDYAGLKFIAAENRTLLDIKLANSKCMKLFPCFNLSWLLAFLPCLKWLFPCLVRMQCMLKVPCLMIDDDTESLFRNLMALEQCHYPLETYICNYVMLINYLIKTEKDVDLLVEKKVIVNYIGSNVEVVTLFNKLCIQIGEASSCYYDLGERLKSHYEHPWNHTWAVMRNTYFRDFGRGIATVAALLTLLSLFVPFFTDIGSKRN